MMTPQEQLENIKSQFEMQHAEIKNKLDAAKAEKDFKRVIALLNEEREFVKRNSEKMLELIARS